MPRTMHAFTTLVASASLFAACTYAAATPGDNWGGYWGPWSQTTNNNGRSSCMSDADAQQVADNFQELIANYSDALANATLTADYEDYSDSVIELINSGCPNSIETLGDATFSSRAAFEVGQASQPAINFQQLNVWHNCDTVTLRWYSDMSPEQVTGIIVMETVFQDNVWLIDTVFSEFNSGAWLVDLDVFKPANCTA